LRKLLFILAIASVILLTGCGLIIINDPVTEESELSDTETAVKEDTSEITETTTSLPETNKPVKPVESEDKRSTADKYLAELPARDFGNLAVMITSTEITSLVPQNTDNTIYNTRIERNQAVEKKYATKIVGAESSYKTIYDSTYSAVNSGDFYSDIIGIPMDGIGQFYKEGLLMNLNMLPFLDYSQPYFDTNAIKQISAGSGTYGLIGDFNKNMDYYYILYFNKTLIKELGLDNPHDLVYNDEWTIDKLRQMTRSVANKEEIYGHGASVTLERYIDMLFESTGEKFMDTGIGVVPKPRYNNPRTANIITAIRGMIYSDNTVFEGTYTSETARTAFYDGKILFYADRVNAMAWFVDMKDDWGAVPFPKFDSSQMYNTFVHEAMPMICVPAGTTNIDSTGLAIQALNAASYGFVNENYYAILQRDVVRDSDTLNMLDYINGKDGKGRIAVDFAFMFGNVYTYIADGTYKSVQSSVMNNYTITSLHDRYYNSIMSNNKNVFKVN